MIVDPIKEAYEAYTTRHCLSIEARAELITQLTTEGVIEAVGFVIGGPIINGTRRTARFINVAEEFIGRSHKEALISILDKQLSSAEITDLIRGGRFERIGNEETREQVKEIVAEYLMQKNPDIPGSEVVALMNEGAFGPDDIKDVFKEIELLNADGSPIKYVDEIINRKRNAKNGQNTTRLSFAEQIQTGVIGKVRVSEDVQKIFDTLNIEPVKERFQDLIEALNIQDRSIRADRLRPYMPRKGFSLVDTDAKHARISRGHPSYVACYKMKNDIIELFFFGTHEEAGLSYDVCK